MTARALKIAHAHLSKVWERVAEELDLDDEDLAMLRVAAARRHGHATGTWGANMPVPGDKADWLVLGVFDTSPYLTDEEGDEYLLGDVRAYCLAPSDILGPARHLLGSDLPAVEFAVFRLRANGGWVMDPMEESAVVEAIAEECRRVMAQVGAGGGEAGDDDENDRTCDECHADTRAWTDPDPGNSDVNKDLAVPKFCGNCGAQLPIKAEVVES